APIANTQSNLPFSLVSPRAGSNGKTIVAAVIMATVDDPWAVFKTDVNKKGKKIPRLPNASDWLKCSPIRAAVKIAPNAPPIPMITNIPPAFSVASCKILATSVFFHCRLQLKANSTPIDKATTGSPAAVNIDSQPRSTIVPVVTKDLPAIKRMGMTIGTQDLTNDGRWVISFSTISSITFSGEFFPAYLAHKLPTIIAGSATHVPINISLPKSTLIIPAAAALPGCGGIRQ